MEFSCNQCQRRYSLPDERVQGKTVKVRCKNCQYLIVLQGGGAAKAPVSSRPTAVALNAPPVALNDEPTRAQPMMDPASQWFAMIQGVQAGPMDSAGLKGKVQEGLLTQRTYVWRDGMADWKRASDVVELVLLFSTLEAPPPARKSPRQEAATRPMADLGAEERTVLAQNLGALFGEIDLAKEREPAREVVKAVQGAKRSRAIPAEQIDPFAALADLDPDQLPPPGESTNFFIAQAGVNRRNPPWKIAAAASATVAGLALLLYILTAFNIVPKEIHRVDASGKEVITPFFSSGGVSALGDLLMGKGKKAKPGNVPLVTPGPGAGPRRKGAEASTRGSNLTKGSRPGDKDLAAFYKDKTDVGPRVAQAPTPSAESEAGGPGDAVVAKVVGQYQPAFQSCIEQQLRRNPNFRGGKIKITATVGGSGVVKHAEIDRREIDQSDLGGCLKTRARRMAFPSFSGGDVDVEIPLVLTTTM